MIRPSFTILSGPVLLMLLVFWCDTQAQEYDNASISDTSSLQSDIIDAHDHRFRPIKNQSSAISVQVEFHLFQIIHIDELEMKMKVSCAFRFRWQDELRTWSPQKYSGLNVIYPDPTDVWRPRVFISNSLGPRDVFKDDYAHLSLFWNGKTQWQPGINLITSCGLNLRFYPFDQQTCNIMVISSSFRKHVQLEMTTWNVFIDSYTENSEWELISSTVELQENGEGLEILSALKISLTLKRNPGFFILNSLLPTMLLSFLSLMVFILPRSSGERAGYCITVMMSLSLIQSTVSAELPHTPQMTPFIVMYLCSLFLLSWVVMVCTIYTLVWESRTENDDRDGLSNHPNNSNNDGVNSSGFVGSMDNSFMPNEDNKTHNRIKDPLNSKVHPFNEDSVHFSSNDGSNDSENRKILFLRDFHKIQEAKSFHADRSKSDKDDKLFKTFRQAFVSRKNSFLHYFTVNADKALFRFFLFTWIAISVVFLIIMIFGG